jgi:hypothetical protein
MGRADWGRVLRRMPCRKRRRRGRGKSAAEAKRA